MNIGELIEQLQQLDPALLVVLSKDAEGNSYEECRDIEGNHAFYSEDNEVKLLKLTPELKRQGYSKEDIAEPNDGSVPCVILWP